MQLSDWTIKQVEGTARTQTVAFMRAQFYQHFTALIEDDTDEVYAVYGPEGHIEAAFGVNTKLQGFFCHHYVDGLSQALTYQYGELPDDVRFVEIAHLCVRKARSLCHLLPLLTEFFAHQADYLICTATRELATFFRRRGLAPNPLATASIDRLPPALRSGWGDYYDHAPVVMSGSLREAQAKVFGNVLEERQVA